MATADPISDLTRPPTRSGYALLALVAALPQEQFDSLLIKLSGLFPPEELLVANKNAFPPGAYPALRVINAPATNTSWTLTAADFQSAYDLAEKHEARHILLLGPDSGSLSPATLQQLAGPVMAGSLGLGGPAS